MNATSIYVCCLTWISAGGDSGATKVAASRDGIPLVVGVKGEGGVVAKRVGGVTPPALLDGGAVGSPMATGVVKG